jgi:hypothetical protein
MQLKLPIEAAADVGDAGSDAIVELRWPDVVAAALGPAMMGATLAWREGWVAALTRAALVPLILAGVLVAMAPALYVGRALSRRALSGDDAIQAALTALTEMGKTALGFAPLALLLDIDSPLLQPTRVAVLATIALAMTIGYLSLYRTLFAQSSAPSRVLFGAWALIGSGIALRLIDIG